MWGSIGFVRMYGHMIHRRPTEPLWQSGASTGVVMSPRTVDRAGHPQPRHALRDCPTLFGTLPVAGTSDATIDSVAPKRCLWHLPYPRNPCATTRQIARRTQNPALQ